MDLYFEKGEKALKLSVSVESGKTGVFQDHYSIPKIRNAAHFFGELEGNRVSQLQMAEGDRLLTMDFDSGDQIIFQLFGNSANVFLVRDHLIENSFKHQKRYNGKEAPIARKPNVKSFKELKGNARQRLTSVNPLLPRNLLPELVDYFHLEFKTNEELADFARKLHQILLDDAVPGVMPDGRLCLLSDEFYPAPNKRIFDTFNEAIRSSYYYRSHLQKFEMQIKGLMSRLEKQHDKLKKRLSNLSAANKSLDRSERYEKYGHLIMANLYKAIEADAREIEVDDLYEEGNVVLIPVKKNLSLTENATLYYDKSREAKKAYQTAGQMLKETEKDYEQNKSLLTGLRGISALRDLEKWKKLHRKELLEMGVDQPEGKQARHPYRKVDAWGYEVWIGKSAKSNDELLKDSHKEDIWLHARGYAGSHVIIRMEKKIQLPEKHVLEKAASYAAKYSKGAGSSLIPVIYTKRKHVRKPKGAAPGQVIVIKEQVILTRSDIS
ncbi:MAG: NFACT RNA binding domain-containing protein [Balneolales bacterium]